MKFILYAFALALLAGACLLPTHATDSTVVTTPNGATYWWCFYDPVAKNCVSTDDTCYCVQVVK